MKFATAEPLPGRPGEGGTLGFLGRFTESRKGFELLRTAFVTLAVLPTGYWLAEPLESRFAQPTQQNSQMRFRAMDANNDGVVTRAEWNGSARSFEMSESADFVTLLVTRSSLR